MTQTPPDGAASRRPCACLSLAGWASSVRTFCELLLRRGHSILGIDNLFPSSARNTSRLQGFDTFQLLNHDVSLPLDIAKPLDGVLHLATSADPVRFRSHPVEVTRAAAFGSLVLLDVAREHDFRFLLASSDAVYGDPLERPQAENTLGLLDPTGPRSAHDEGKRFAESLTMAYHTQWGVDNVIARIFHSYAAAQALEARARLPLRESPARSARQAPAFAIAFAGNFYVNETRTHRFPWAGPFPSAGPAGS